MKQTNLSYELNQEYSNCEECGETLIKTSSSFTCSQCGLENAQTYEDALLKISARDDDETGAFSYYGERVHIVDGIGSFIDFYGTMHLKDGKGSRLSRHIENKFLRLKRINDLQLHTMNKESDYRALRVLNRMVSFFQFSKHIRGRSAYLLRIMTRYIPEYTGLNRIILVATAFYISIRENSGGNPITLNELVDGFKDQGHRISKKLIIRALWTLRPKLSKILDFSKILSTSNNYIPTVFQKLQSSENIKNRIRMRKINEQEYFHLLQLETRALLEKIPYQARGGRNPYIFTVSTAYAADHIVSKNKLGVRAILSQKAIAEATNVAEYSVRDHYARVIREFVELSLSSHS